ncbi:MFS transporter [Ovoidimarina sediminis]|uniref:MFS transporter n=1 Tax=Ovoidimarina sediminis TaxID=3079856 RepID=UPI0029108789|nr:MFS transporter [Rhodophyticola sp. MJ-SS7]MDU8941887.1 MFS transporter [Rhodophyticola sp. MJ-SS7]
MTTDRALSKPEFIALMAMLFSTIAFSIDAMLPALPEIAAELTPGAPNLAQLIVTSFVLGLGVGTLFSGPMADAFGRRRVIAGGALLYILGALLAWQAASLELILAARVLQGLGASGPRIAAMAIIRDKFEGREMAQLVSLMMMVFTLVPALAPAMGAGIIAMAGWRAIFLAFIVFSAISVIWLSLRQPETLTLPARRPFRPAKLRDGFLEVIANPMVRLCLLSLILTFGALFSVLVTAQPIFDVTFGQGHKFHWWFMLISVIGAMGNFANAKLVMIWGMRRVALTAFAVQTGAAILMILVSLSAPWNAPWALYAYVAWAAVNFTVLGLTIGNINAIAMTPMGHMAGMTASILGSMSTVGAVIVAVPLGLTFNGTPLSVAIGIAICAGAAFVIASGLKDPEPTPIKEALP